MHAVESKRVKKDARGRRFEGEDDSPFAADSQASGFEGWDSERGRRSGRSRRKPSGSAHVAPPKSASRRRSWSFAYLAVRSKMLSVLAALLAVTVTVGVFGLAKLSSTHSTTTAMYNDNLLPVATIGEIRAAALTSKVDFSSFALAQDPKIAAQALAMTQADDATVQTLYHQYLPHAASPVAMRKFEADWLAFVARRSGFNCWVP